jgi:hypothetical protein
MTPIYFNSNSVSTDKDVFDAIFTLKPVNSIEIMAITEIYFKTSVLAKYKYSVP